MVEARLAHAAPRTTWHITGWTQEPQAYFGAIDLLAMTSRFEGLSLALLESTGPGLPALVTDFIGARDLAERAPWVPVVARSDRLVAGAELTCPLPDFPD